MTRFKSRSRVMRENKIRGTSILPCQAPVPEPMKSNPRVWQLAVDSVLSSTNKINVGTNRGSPVNGDLKARKSSRRREKKLLARSVRKQLAAASIIHQGKTQTGATHVKMTRKERRKLDTTVEKAPAEYGGDRKTTVVYTDGSCFSNGKPNASAGVGVWWGLGDERNISERCPGPQDSGCAEMFAVIRLLEEAPMTEERSRLVIRTDSKYVIDGVMSWGPKWKTQRRKIELGGNMKNSGMIQYLLALLSLRATQGQIVVFEHVRGHSNSIGNNAADALAKRGAKDPIVPERDWLAERRCVEEVEADITSFNAVENSRTEDSFRFVIEEDELLAIAELEELARTPVL